MGPGMDHDQSCADPSDAADLARGRLRLDKWLWYARFVKTRSLAAKLCTAGRIRLTADGMAAGGAVHVSKASHMVKVGDVLTFPLGPHIRVIRVLALADRRGPAPEAKALYQDLSPPSPATRMER